MFLALSLTPALCATFLKPVEAGHKMEKGGIFGWFNRGFKATTHGYENWVAKILRRTGRFLVIFGLIVAVVVFMFTRMPSSFLPTEDQGYLIANVQLPPGATQARTLAVMQQAEGFFLSQPEVDKMVSVLGFSFSGSGQNAALAFVPLKPWDERKGAEHSAQTLAGRAFGALAGVRDAFVFALVPPAIPELGTATGFSFRLQDRGGNGHGALVAARNQLLGMAAQSKVLAGVRPDGLEDAPQLFIDIDRDRASALGVSFDNINAVLSTALGSTYVNDFPNAGRLQRVIVQADAPDRMQPDDLMQLNVVNNQGKPVPMAALASTRWITGPIQTIRFNGYPSMRISGDAAPGFSTGDAMDEMERLAGQLPAGFAFEWTGQSREERLSGSTALILLAFSMLAVFLCLSALYESWSIPFAVLLAVPLGVLGAVLGATMRGMPNDVFFKVGLITVIGLSAKNAILIIEFAKDLVAQGKDVIEATLQAVHLRFRPILMTSIAFILGVLPLVVSSGAGSASQRAIGTGVMGGMITATVLAIFFVPVFFVVVRRIFKSPVMLTAGTPPDAGPAGGRAARQGCRPCVARPCPRAPRSPSRRWRSRRARRWSRSTSGRPRRCRRPIRPTSRRRRARRRGRRRHRLAALLRRPAPEAPDRARARQQPRPARRRPQHRAGAGDPPDPPRRRVSIGRHRRGRRRARRSATASRRCTRSASPSPATSSTCSAASTT